MVAMRSWFLVVATVTCLLCNRANAFTTSSLGAIPRGRTMVMTVTSPRLRTVRYMSDSSMAQEEPPKKGFMGRLKAVVPPANERQKLLPLALMFFCILFNYTILRDTKDVLMITAPKSGAEVIPFIKTYVNLPVAIVSQADPSQTVFALRRPLTKKDSDRVSRESMQR